MTLLSSMDLTLLPEATMPIMHMTLKMPMMMKNKRMPTIVAKTILKKSFILLIVDDIAVADESHGKIRGWEALHSAIKQQS